MCIRDSLSAVLLNVSHNALQHAGLHCHYIVHGINVGPVSYTHLDVYKRQHYNLVHIEQKFKHIVV